MMGIWTVVVAMGVAIASPVRSAQTEPLADVGDENPVLLAVPAPSALPTTPADPADQRFDEIVISEALLVDADLCLRGSGTWGDGGNGRIPLDKTGPHNTSSGAVELIQRSAVPEPATIAVFLVGAAMLWARHRPT